MVVSARKSRCKMIVLGSVVMSEDVKNPTKNNNWNMNTKTSTPTEEHTRKQKDINGRLQQRSDKHETKDKALYGLTVIGNSCR
ncbi:hypothetical protein DPX16_20949 [Anabarilius grahami]|uniref:Uncharacterized protein n=1 Tax=Anabarilius grahami TaxID=495550 RepID=A0A3N0XQF6_ANAGA|nr:hypothetical protein DPX16_20949 [Anabarilius grahami]